jgi:nitrite reductase (NO-forming)
MEGKLIVGEGAAAEESDLPSIVRDPSDLPGPIGQRGSITHDLTLTTTEVKARLADGTSYKFWTFGNKVPGPMLRVRVGDTVNLTLENAENSTMIHSIDLHAVNGPGGGAGVTQIQPGNGATFSFRALKPGLYVYHCATPMVTHHITNGMYGLILVEPEGGLPEVDKEFYVMQGEVYTHQAFGQRGLTEFDVQRLLDEAPEYFVFNGAVGALTDEYPMQANVGETVRIFFGVGGPNFTSSFHAIGEIFDRVYDQGSLTTDPLTGVQTTLVPAGGATMVEFKLEVPRRYILVDHALSRAERGLVGFLEAGGPENPEVFHGTTIAGSGH